MSEPVVIHLGENLILAGLALGLAFSTHSTLCAITVVGCVVNICGTTFNTRPRTP
jgi:hypothetical protein